MCIRDSPWLVPLPFSGLVSVKAMGAHVRKLGIRAIFAVRVVRIVNRLSRLLGRGEGTVIGGRVGLAIDSQLLRKLAKGRQKMCIRDRSRAPRRLWRRVLG